ncbi:MAG TPA: hypothetical protein VHE32_10650 [Rhodanobacteraceae bacterium]|jgi:hypothetical protein|nr:hypothetical protein [Rhodanobacteraceae bacterium]
MARARTTDSDQKRSAVALIKSVAILQLKLLLDTVRDLALAPTAIAAALLDLLLIKHQDPRFFRSVLRIGEYSDRWIDVWSGGRHPDEPQRENVDALIARVEEVVRDPEIGARRARVLRRWAERQMARARQRTAATPPQPPEPPKAVPRDRTSP